MGEGRAAGRVGSDFLVEIAGWVGSTFCRVGSGPRKVARGQLWEHYYNSPTHYAPTQEPKEA